MKQLQRFLSSSSAFLQNFIGGSSVLLWHTSPPLPNLQELNFTLIQPLFKPSTVCASSPQLPQVWPSKPHYHTTGKTDRQAQWAISHTAQGRRALYIQVCTRSKSNHQPTPRSLPTAKITADIKQEIKIYHLPPHSQHRRNEERWTMSKTNHGIIDQFPKEILDHRKIFRSGREFNAERCQAVITVEKFDVNGQFFRDQKSTPWLDLPTEVKRA